MTLSSTVGWTGLVIYTQQTSGYYHKSFDSLKYYWMHLILITNLSCLVSVGHPWSNHRTKYRNSSSSVVNSFLNILCSVQNFKKIFFHHTYESTCDTLLSSAANQGDNTVLVAQGDTATPSATKQLLPLDRVFVGWQNYLMGFTQQQYLELCSFGLWRWIDHII